MSPVRVIWPPEGSVSPARVLVRVVLPAPLRPTSPILSPECDAEGRLFEEHTGSDSKLDGMGRDHR